MITALIYTRDAAHRGILRAPLLVICVCALAPLTLALPPIDPLPPPLYSFDNSSHSVASGFVQSNEVLMLDAPHPTPAFSPDAIGLFSPYDDIDALSGNRVLDPNETFVILFSVDRETVGLYPPDHEYLTLGVPYNVYDQAQRGHAAGDQFVATVELTRGGVFRALGPRQVLDNPLVRNNYDEGGTDFSAEPPTSAHDLAVGAAQDNVNSTAYTGSSSASLRSRTIVDLYFTLTRESPSLYTLPGSEPSGASIFYNADPNSRAPTELFADSWSLGLNQADNIDALLIIDNNEVGVFDLGDEVYFSLDANSPTLQILPDASDIGAAADIFRVRYGQGPQLFISVAELGLGHPADNIDALEVFPAVDATAFAEHRGIRSLRGDLNCDGVVNNGDIDPFVIALNDPAMYQLMYPHCNIEMADCNLDSMINNGDIDAFLLLL